MVGKLERTGDVEIDDDLQKIAPRAVAMVAMKLAAEVTSLNT